jgi:hypothetical protein
MRVTVYRIGKIRNTPRRFCGHFGTEKVLGDPMMQAWELFRNFRARLR